MWCPSAISAVFNPQEQGEIQDLALTSPWHARIN